jgi:hypothetical protein
VDRGFDVHGYGVDTHGPQQLCVQLGQVLGDGVAPTDGDLRGEPPNPVPEVRVESAATCP